MWSETQYSLFCLKLLTARKKFLTDPKNFFYSKKVYELPSRILSWSASMGLFLINNILKIKITFLSTFDSLNCLLSLCYCMKYIHICVWNDACSTFLFLRTLLHVHCPAHQCIVSVLLSFFFINVFLPSRSFFFFVTLFPLDKQNINYFNKTVPYVWAVYING